MELAQYLEYDIKEYLEAIKNKETEKRSITGGSANVFDLERDYIKDVDHFLDANQAQKAMFVFDKVREHYNKLKLKDESKKPLFKTLKEIFIRLNTYSRAHPNIIELRKELHLIEREGSMKKDLPESILSAAPKVSGDFEDIINEDVYTTESQLEEEERKIDKEFIQKMAKEISKNIHVEDDTAATSIVHNTGGKPGQADSLFGYSNSSRQNAYPASSNTSHAEMELLREQIALLQRQISEAKLASEAPLPSQSQPPAFVKPPPPITQAQNNDKSVEEKKKRLEEINKLLEAAQAK